MERRRLPYTEMREDVDGNLLSAAGYIQAPRHLTVIRLNSSDEIESFRKNPEGFFAERHGATVEQYRDWIDTDGRPRCAGRTAKGRHCRKLVPGARFWPFDAWLRAHRRKFCAVHRGPLDRADR